MDNLQPLNVTYYTRNNYGTAAKYPVSDDAKLLAFLSGTKTLTDDAISIATLHGRGATVEEVFKPR